ncbi:MAG: NodT family efflux transporter outer membrane lipoprotein [bacterium]|nr:MAG: NodT family efflux transporter outer membrane lipoprotein [bacterium]KAF0148962.1 MAG: NodT family efflux transporter outer membrane lipoprotein [bacterium]KAF0168353.1 MAG: NodT family efflux transporter outer membrane lipoprotein [bacterium]TXT22667.1 MAG: NodT family efflux transporter outer membrane lipoprotein [bacterium]
MMRISPWLLACLALAGCQAVGPDYTRPAVALPASYAAASEEGQARVRADWWTLFGDPLLDELIARTQAGNFDLQAAVARVEQAEAALRVVGAAQAPSLDLDAGARRMRSSTETGMPMPQYSSEFGLGLSTAFELDFWGRLRRAEEAARANFLASRHARDSLRISLAGMLANTYFSLRALDAELAVNREALVSREETLRIVGSRVEGGVASPLDLRQAEGDLAAGQAQLANLRRLRALAESQLALLVGTPGLRIDAGSLYDLPLPPPPPPGLPSDLLQARPDLRQAEEELIANNARIGVAKAALYPNISLTGALGSRSQDLANLFSAGAQTWSLGVGLLLPVFDGGAGRARVDQASARQREALAAYQQAIHNAFREVGDALVEVREHAIAEAAQDRRVGATAQALELARVRYEAGYSGYLEVLVAQRGLNESQLAQVLTRRARLIAAVDLFKALGGGWLEAEAGASAGVEAPIRRADDPPPTPPPPRASAG